MPVISLVGHPNVGKSTIFNKLVGQKISIIEDTPGVTRDRIYSEATYKDYKFNIIDTGGIDDSNDFTFICLANVKHCAKTYKSYTSIICTE